MAFCNSISMKSSYMQFFFTYNSTSWRSSKIEFQKRGISLISLGKRTKYWIIIFKRAKANFFLTQPDKIVICFLGLFFFFFFQLKHDL